MSSAGEELTRAEKIYRQRAITKANVVLSSVALTQLVFASFAVGHAIGPAPTYRSELIVGIGLTFLVGVLTSVPLVRRRLESGAVLKLVLKEGRHRRRVLVFGDHLVVDREVVMRDEVSGVEMEGNRLVLKYRDPIHSGRVLREFEGDAEILRALVNQLLNAES